MVSRSRARIRNGQPSGSGPFSVTGITHPGRLEDVWNQYIKVTGPSAPYIHDADPRPSPFFAGLGRNVDAEFFCTYLTGTPPPVPIPETLRLSVKPQYVFEFRISGDTASKDTHTCTH